MLSTLTDQLRDRNEFPVLLYVQPADGTTVRYLHVCVMQECYPHDQGRGSCGCLGPTRLDSVFRTQIDSDTAGFFYLPFADDAGIPIINPPYEDPSAGFGIKGGLGNGRIHITTKGYIDDQFYTEELPLVPSRWPAFWESIYIDLLPNDASLTELPEVLVDVMVGAKPAAPPPSGFDVNVKWDLSAKDIVTLIDVLAQLTVLLGGGL